MSKLLICGDVHWSTYSSIIRRRGNKYSKRLENLINSVNWVEEMAEQYGCEKVIYAGDFFDRSDMNAEELTALQEIVWAPVNHIMLIGNHEGLTNDLSLSSSHVFKLIPNVKVIDKPELDSGFGYRLLYLPYILEKDRKESVSQYIRDLNAGYFETQEVKYNIVISHNDIKMKFGMFESKEGFDPEDIDKSCEFFFNGHLHSECRFSKAGYNIGNLTGQNFGENAFEYDHHVIIFDTETKSITFKTNPYAFNFYKFDCYSLDDLNDKLKKIDDNAILSIKAPEAIVSDVKEILDNNPLVKEFKVISIISKKDSEELKNQIDDLNCVNHLEAFITYVKDNLTVNELMLSELSEVCK